jgi:hypothetical protein
MKQSRLHRTALAAAGKAILAGRQRGLPQSVVRRVARRAPPAFCYKPNQRRTASSIWAISLACKSPNLRSKRAEATVTSP